MMICLLCGSVVYICSSFQVFLLIKECYNQCQNINCSYIFVIYEIFVCLIVMLKELNLVQLYLMKLGQVVFFF